MSALAASGNSPTAHSDPPQPALVVGSDAQKILAGCMCPSELSHSLTEDFDSRPQQSDKTALAVVDMQ